MGSKVYSMVFFLRFQFSIHWTNTCCICFTIIGIPAYRTLIGMAASAVAGLVIFTSVGTESPRTVKHGQTKTYRNHRAFVWGIPKTNGLVIGVWPGPQMEPWPNLRANMAASGFRLHRTTMTTMKRRGKRNPKKKRMSRVFLFDAIYMSQTSVTKKCDTHLWQTVTRTHCIIRSSQRASRSSVVTSWKVTLEPDFNEASVPSKE